VTTVKEIAEALENFAPLPLQEEYDNSGLQVGLTESEVSGVLLCLDVTESVIEEAHRNGLNLIVSHHPLLFHRLSRLTDANYVERCVRKAITYGISIYSAHTNLDNVIGGVNHMIARRLGLKDITWLRRSSEMSGSGLVGILPQELAEEQYIEFVKTVFAAECIQYNGSYGKPIRKVALCGGAGSFLIEDAVKCKADAFITGEAGYHDMFGYTGQLLITVTGHYESEQYTIDLFQELLSGWFPTLEIKRTSIRTNSIKYYI